MGYESLRRATAPTLLLILSACAGPAPFPLLGEAEQCIESVEAEGAGYGSVEDLLAGAAAYTGAARRTSERPEAEHYAHLALQQCRTARTRVEGHHREENIANLELSRLHLMAGLRALHAKAASRQAVELSSQLGIEQGEGPGLSIPIGRGMFGRGGRGLQASAGPLIREVAAFLREHRQWQISVASTSGAQARQAAASVRHSLVARGLTPERILLRQDPDTGFVRLSIIRPQ